MGRKLVSVEPLTGEEMLVVIAAAAAVSEILKKNRAERFVNAALAGADVSTETVAQICKDDREIALLESALAKMEASFGDEEE